MKSKRNKQAGKSTGTSESAKYFKSNPDARKKKNEYQKEYNKKADQKKYRAELNAENHKRGTYGNGDNKDVSHTKSGKKVLEKRSTNRARNGKNGKSTKK